MTGPDVVHVSVTVAARPSTVFRFLSDPARLQAWLGPGADVEPVPGGRFLLRYPGGAEARGTVESVEPDRRLAFTYGYAGGEPAPGSTRVTIELEAIEGGTRVVLRHEGLPDVPAREGHRRGWRHYLSVLAARSAHEHVSVLAGPATDAFVAAWNAGDERTRAESLERSFEAEGAFRGAMASVVGRDELCDYIAATRAYAPGVRLVLEAAPDHAHDRVRFPWRFESADGRVLGRGWNYARLTLAGRFDDVVGFDEWGTGT